MLDTLTSVVLPPVETLWSHRSSWGPITLTFFCDLEGPDAPRVLLATLQTWLTISNLSTRELSPEELARLAVDGEADEDAWYACASRTMAEAKLSLEGRAECLAALPGVQHVLWLMGPTGSLLAAYLKNSFSEELA